MSRIAVALVVLLLPAVAGAQTVSPTSPAHPAMPWGLGVAIPTGQLLRDMWVPPQTVVIDTMVPMVVPPKEGEPEEGKPASAPVPAAGSSPTTEPTPTTEETPESDTTLQYAVQRQTVVVPGYWVRQTTAGDYYPQRWALEQIGPGQYRWRLLPAEVRSR